MGNQYLHIVCLDVPYPPDYGGVFDLFYKIRFLHEAGIRIHLHCFEYGRGKQAQLNNYCSSVRYYPRKSLLSSLSFQLPYIVNSRACPELLHNLSQDDYPVLLEGIHCTYFLFTGSLAGKKVLVRLHNVEYQYYNRLAKTTRNLLKRIFFELESRLLKKYETALAVSAHFIAVSQKDVETYRRRLRAQNIEYLPVFLPFQKVESTAGTGNFCLYHGNLSVPENERVALWLIHEIFDHSQIPLIIAGKDPTGKLKKAIAGRDHICMVANPQEKELSDLIRKAQLHLLPSLNATGIKIKLIHALYNGRHVIANQAAIENTGLESLCVIAEGADSFAAAIQELFKKPFTEKDIACRKAILEKLFNNERNASQLITWIC